MSYIDKLYLLKEAAPRMIKNLRAVLNDSGIPIKDRLARIQSLARTAGSFLPEGRLIGKTPLRGEENTLTAYTRGLKSGNDEIRFGNAPVVVEKVPIEPGILTSPEKHKKTIELWKSTLGNPNIVPHSVAMTPNKNPKTVGSSEYGERVFQPLLEQAPGLAPKDLFKGTDSRYLAEGFRLGILGKFDGDINKFKTLVDSERAKLNDYKDIFKTTKGITDLKPDNFIFNQDPISGKNRLRLADMSPSDDSPAAMAAAARHKFYDLPLYVKGTPYQRWSDDLSSQVKDRSAVGLIKRSPLEILKGGAGYLSHLASNSKYDILDSSLASILKGNEQLTQRDSEILDAILSSRHFNTRSGDFLKSSLNVPSMARVADIVRGSPGLTRVLRRISPPEHILPDRESPDRAVVEEYLSRRTPGYSKIKGILDVLRAGESGDVPGALGRLNPRPA